VIDDKKIGHLLDDVSRRVGRRKLLTNGLKGVAAAVAGLTVGTLPSRAFAHEGHPYCHYPGAGHCSNIGKSCPSNGCPSGCNICVLADGCGCPYTSGAWTTSQSCGLCGFGYYLCWDCRCTSCSNKCGCKSSCRCSGCCRVEEVKRDMAAAMSLAAAQN
jgi:hypothetical protein